MVDITFLMGANATGKSTRMKSLVDSLGEDYEDYEYTFIDDKKSELKTVIVGRLYSNGFLVMGSEAKNAAGWVCLDKAILSKQDTRTTFYKWVMKNDDRVKRIFVEGYFNTMSPRSRPTFLRETGFNDIDCFFMFYDTVEDFIERTERRSGSTWEEKGKDARTSAGWKDNLGFMRAFDKSLKEDNNPSDGRKVMRLPIDAPIDYFVRKYG